MMRSKRRKNKQQVFLKSLYLQNFRNYEKGLVDFSPKINTLLGKNAAGKTSLLEAIYLIATGKSFRTQNLTELIKEGAPFFFLEALIEKEGVEIKIKISFDGQNKLIQIGKSSFRSFAPLLGLLPFVLLTPYDIEMIQGAPSIRRRFLNIHLAQSDPLYVHHLSAFSRGLQQRNVLLKQKITEGIECFEEKMALSAQYIVQARATFLKELKLPLSKIYFSEKKEKIDLLYRPSCSEGYIQLLSKMRHKEMLVGTTLNGPHRDDFLLLIDGKPAKNFASEGQKKTAIAQIRFAELENLQQSMTTFPLMGLDDIDQHLDQGRVELLFQRLSTLGQVFITTPTTSLNIGQQILIERGQIEQVHVGLT